MIKQLNPCDTKSWHLEFLSNPFYQDKIKSYDKVISSQIEATLLKAALHHTVYASSREINEQYSIVDSTPHYYIKFLLERNPEIIADIGCGLNVFKKIYPNIIGIDNDPKSNFDIFDSFDADFCQGHREHYDGIISINTIHFSPITLVKKRLLMIAELLKSGKRAFVSTNIETWLMFTDYSTIVKLFGPYPKLEDVLNYIHEQIIGTELNFLVIDYPILSYYKESTIRDDYNGNIRVVFEK